MSNKLAKKEGNWWKLWLFWLLIWFDCVWLSDYHVSSELQLQQVCGLQKINFKFDIFNLCSRHSKEHHISVTWIWIEYILFWIYFYYILFPPARNIGGSPENLLHWASFKTNIVIVKDSAKCWGILNPFLSCTILAQVLSGLLFVSICHHKNSLNLQ